MASIAEAKKADYQELPRDFDPKAMPPSVSIGVGDLGYTDGKSATPVLESNGAGPCVIVAARNPQTSETVMVHITPNNDPESLKVMFSQIRGKDPNAPLDVHLAGALYDAGDDSRSNLMKVLNIVEQDKHATIRTADIYNEHDASRGIIINARTGQVYVTDAVKDNNAVGELHAKQAGKEPGDVLRSNSNAAIAHSYGQPLTLTSDTRGHSVLPTDMEALRMEIQKACSGTGMSAPVEAGSPSYENIAKISSLPHAVACTDVGLNVRH